MIFDGRNLYDPDTLATLGIRYYAIGRSNEPASGEQNHNRRKTDRLKVAES